MRAILHSTGNSWQQRYQDYFISGLGYHGVKVGVSRLNDAAPADFHIVFANNSWQATLDECKAKGMPVLTVNRCFFGDRHDNVAIGWDGFNGKAEFYNHGMSNDRWEKHGVPVQPWRETTRDGQVLVLGEFRQMGKWYQKVDADIRASHWKNFPIVYRPHPFRAGERQCGWAPAPGKPQDDIETALNKAALCITYDTIGGIDALINGVPTVAYGQYSMARPIAASKIMDVFYLRDRAAWLNDLAYAQWHYGEIADGSFWGHIGTRMANS